jgi:proteasome component ECM29
VHSIDAGFKDELLHQLEAEKNLEAKSLLRKCIDIIENLKLENAQ